MQNPKFEIPQNNLTLTIESLKELARRLEADAVALATVHTRETVLRSAELMEQAEAVRELYDFYLHL